MAFIGDKIWSDDDQNFLIRHHGKRSNRQLAQDLGRTVRAIEGRVRMLRTQGVIPPYEFLDAWTEAEDRQLLAGRRQFTVKMLAEDLGRSETAVTARIKRLKDQGWQIEAMPRGRLRSKQAEQARAAHKPIEVPVTAEREAMRDEVIAYLSAQVKRNLLALEQAQLIAKTISQRVLQAPEWQFKKLANRSVVEIVQEAA